MVIRERIVKKLSIYLDEDYMYGNITAYEAVVDLLYEKNVAGVSVFKGITGYGSRRILHKAKILDLSGSLPIKIEAIDSEGVINSILSDVRRIVGKGLVEVCDTKILVDV